MAWIFIVGLVIVLLCTAIGILREENKYLRKMDKLHRENYKLLLARAIEQSVENAKRIEPSKLKEFIENAQITDDYLGSILVTSELKQAIDSGILQKNGGRISEM